MYSWIIFKLKSKNNNYKIFINNAHFQSKYIVLMKTMVYRENSSFNISTEIMNLNADQTEFHLYNDYGFAFGVSLTNYNAEPIELKPEVFTMTV